MECNIGLRRNESYITEMTAVGRRRVALLEMECELDGMIWKRRDLGRRDPMTSGETDRS